MAAYYNESDPVMVDWLRALMTAGHIADGEIDARSIALVSGSDLAGFTQCHFFAGIGGWSYALRLAGWPDDQPVWTGSCPCQPFSVAGRRAGAADERHLWPVWFPLICERAPDVVFGEQVASRGGLAWFDAVSTDLEAADYAVAAVDLCAASVGAPHIRQRLYWVALAHGSRLEGLAGDGDERDQSRWLESVTDRSVAASGAARELADADAERRQQFRTARLHDYGPSGDHVARCGTPGIGLADAASGRGRPGDAPTGRQAGRVEPGAVGGMALAGCEPARGRDSGSVEGARTADERSSDQPGRSGGSVWDGSDWIYCRDERWRPIEPGTFPLADGVSGRVGRLRGYGNAIVPSVAASVIAATLAVLPR